MIGKAKQRLRGGDPDGIGYFPRGGLATLRKCERQVKIPRSFVEDVQSAQ